jgi:hypothetical protein
LEELPVHWLRVRMKIATWLANDLTSPASFGTSPISPATFYYILQWWIWGSC